jgi:hypothetical protein
MSLPLFGFVTISTNLIPAGTGIARYKRLTKPMQILAILSVYACAELAVEIAAAKYLKNNSFLDDYSTLVEFSLLWGVYFFGNKSQKIKWFLVGFGVFFLIAWVAGVTMFNSPQPYGGRLAVPSRIVLIALSLIVLQEVFKNQSLQIIEQSVFWVALGVLLYSAGTIMVFGFATRLLKLGVPYFEMAWRVNWVLIISANLFYTKALLCKAPN